MSAVQVASAAAIGLALYAGHHVGDYWIQTDHQAKHKGDDGEEGVAACLAHVATYVLTQFGCLVLLWLAARVEISVLGLVAGLAVSGVTHYLADRREHGIMFRLARAMGDKVNFLELGKPRKVEIYAREIGDTDGVTARGPIPLDNPSLGTGAWALDQAWHIFWGVFVAALLMAGLS